MTFFKVIDDIPYLGISAKLFHMVTPALNSVSSPDFLGHQFENSDFSSITDKLTFFFALIGALFETRLEILCIFLARPNSSPPHSWMLYGGD